MTGCWKENHGEDIGYKDIMHISLHPDSLFIRHFYIQMHLHTYFAFKPFCTKTTQTLLPTNPFYIHRRLCTQTHLQYTDVFFLHAPLLRTDAFTRKDYCTQKLLYTNPILALLYTGAFTHRRSYAQTFSHTEALAYRSFYPQRQSNIDHRCLCRKIPLQTEAFTNRRIYTKIFLRTDAFIHRCFYNTQGRWRQMLLHASA